MYDRKPIKGYEGLYAVDTDGIVYSEARTAKARRGIREVPAIIRTPSKNKNGYPVLQLWRDGKYANLRVNRLVAETFIPNPDGLPEVNHIDGDKTNNHVENLEWASRRENADHARRTGLYAVGENHPNAKLCDEAVRDARRRRGEGEPYRHIAADHGVHPGTIRAAVKRKSWAHVEEEPQGIVSTKGARHAGTRPPSPRGTVQRPARPPHAQTPQQAL